MYHETWNDHYDVRKYSNAIIRKVVKPASLTRWTSTLVDTTLAPLILVSSNDTW